MARVTSSPGITASDTLLVRSEPVPAKKAFSIKVLPFPIRIPETSLSLFERQYAVSSLASESFLLPPSKFIF